MSKKLPVRDLAKAGLNSDLIAWDLPPNYLTDIKNVRMTRGALIPSGGYSEWAPLPADFNPGHIFYTTSPSGDFWIIPGEDSVQLWNGADFFDISSVEGYLPITNPDLWTSTQLANVPIINHPHNVPEYWPAKSQTIPFEALPWDATRTWADVGEACDVMRSHKSYLFALGLYSGANVWQDGVRWSSPADVGGIPETWDPLDITNTAGLVGLGSDGGRIVDGLPLRDAFVVYRESGISIFDYVGGQYVWRIRHLSTTMGLSNPNSIVEAGGKHYFIGNANVMVNDGNQISSLMHDRVRTRFANDFDEDNYVNSFVIKNKAYNEIWFCVPSSGDVYPTVVYVYNWSDDTWAIRDFPTVVSAGFGVHSTAPRNWENTDENWGNATGSWSSGRANAFNQTVAGVIKGTPGSLLDLDTELAAVDVPFDTKIERTGIALEGLDVVTTIQSIFPHIDGTGGVNVEVGSQDYPGAPTRWKPPVVFRIGIDRKVDIRTTGELHSFRFSLNGVNTTFRLSGFDIQYVLAGTR